MSFLGINLAPLGKRLNEIEGDIGRFFGGGQPQQQAPAPPPNRQAAANIAAGAGIGPAPVQAPMQMPGLLPNPVAPVVKPKVAFAPLQARGNVTPLDVATEAVKGVGHSIADPVVAPFNQMNAANAQLAAHQQPGLLGAAQTTLAQTGNFAKAIGQSGVNAASYVAPEVKLLKGAAEASPLVKAAVGLINHGASSAPISVAGSLANGNRNPADIAKQAAIASLTAGVVPGLKEAGVKGLPAETVHAAGPGEVSKFDAQKYAAEQSQKAEDAAKTTGPGVLNKAKVAFRKSVVDALSPIEDPINQATGGFHSAESLKLRDALDRSLRSNTISGQFAKDNGLDKIIQTVPNPKEFDQYLIARHAADLEKNGIKTGRDVGKDAQLVDALAPKYEDQAQNLNRYNNTLLDKAVEHGLVSKDTATYLKQKYPNYVPLERVFTEDELQGAKGTGSAPASLSRQTAVRRIEGSKREISSPLQSVVHKTHDVLTQGLRSDAARAVADTAKIEGNPLGVRLLKPGEEIQNKPTISTYKNGIKEIYEVNPEVADAAKSLSKEQIGFIGQLFAIPTRVLRLGATGLNPAFAAANVAKDAASAFINSEHSLRSSIANPQVFVQALKASVLHGSAEHGELVREGAGGTSFDIARNEAKQSVALIRSHRNAATRTGYVVTHPGELIRAAEDIIGRSEEFTRAMQYYGNKQAAEAKGLTGRDAIRYGADAARNNTVNFSRAGTFGQVLNTALPYLNAGFQGSRTLLRNLKERPVATGSKIAVAVLFPVAATTAWNLGDPERKRAYDDITETEKQNNIIIVPPHPKQDDSGRWNVIKIPLSQEVANLGSVVRNGVESMADDKSFNFGALAGNLFGTATSLNAQSPRQLVGQTIPQALKPSVESLTNQNLFTGQQIVPSAMENLPANQQVNKTTSGTAKVLGGLTGQSPLKVDNAIRTATGGLGQNLIHESDKALAATGVIKPNEVKGKGFIDAMANRFNSAQGQTPGSQFYSTIQKTSAANGLSGSDYNGLQTILSKGFDGDGQPIPATEKSAQERSAILSASPKAAKVMADTAIALGKAQGNPVDPLYSLTPEQQNTYYKLQSTPYQGPEYGHIATTNASWLKPFETARSQFFTANPISNATPTDRVQYPKFDSQTQSLMSQASQLTAIPSNKRTPAQAGQINAIYSQPNVQAAFAAIDKYTNDRRVAQGFDPIKNQPQASPYVQRQLDAKNYKDPQTANYLMQVAEYNVEKGGAAALFQGTDFSQSALKGIYSLGNYDIAKNPDGTYALGSPGGGTGGSRGSYKPYTKLKKFKSYAKSGGGGKVKQAKAKGGSRVAVVDKERSSKPKVSIRKSLV